MDIIGHQKIINFLRKSQEKNKIFQAYLFAGPEHLGKFKVALKFAQEITQGKNQKINPDITVIAPEIENKKGIIRKKNIKISAVREMEKELALFAYNGKYKVAIIDEAEQLTLAAQNALLKILEDPIEKSVLILVCHNLEKMLDTIKSRCVIKKFSLVSPDEISQIISDSQHKEEIIFWSLGRPGIAIKLRDSQKELQSREKIKLDFKQLLTSGINGRFAQAEELSKNKPKLIEKMNLWIIILRENIFKNNNFLRINPAQALSLIEKINKTLQVIQETNVNVRLALENLFLNF